MTDQVTMLSTAAGRMIGASLSDVLDTATWVVGIMHTT